MWCFEALRARAQACGSIQSIKHDPGGAARMSQHSIDLTVFLVVVALRLGVPLFVPRFPLPAMIAAMLIDAADQTIFQRFTHLDLTNYQGYDKALDVYYLSI